MSAFGEYRVYQFYVKPVYQIQKDEKSYIVTTTMNPTTYLTYHGGRTSISIDLLRTWTCKGYTGLRKELCKSPSRQVANIINEE